MTFDETRKMSFFLEHSFKFIAIPTQFSQKGNSSRKYDAFPLTRFDENGHSGNPHFPMPSKILILMVSVAKLAGFASLGIKISWRKSLTICYFATNKQTIRPWSDN